MIGFPPGGTSDVIARLIVDRMRTSLGTSVVVENKPGANGQLAAEALKNAAPDGRTLMISPIAVTVFAPLTHTKLRYDPINDFAPVSLAANFQMALAVGPGSPATTLHEYIAWVRANPAKATYGMPTAGGPPHFFGVMLARATGVDQVVVTPDSAACRHDVLHVATRRCACIRVQPAAGTSPRTHQTRPLRVKAPSWRSPSRRLRMRASSCWRRSSVSETT